MTYNAYQEHKQMETNHLRELFPMQYFRDYWTTKHKNKETRTGGHEKGTRTSRKKERWQNLLAQWLNTLQAFKFINTITLLHVVPI